MTEPCVSHIHSHPPPFRTTLIMILHDIQTSDPPCSMLRLPPCSCSVLIVNIDSPRISVHFSVVILRPPCSVTLRVPVNHAPMLHMTDHCSFPPCSIAIHRPCLRPSFLTFSSRL